MVELRPRCRVDVMDFEWDEDKARSNLRKHGVSFRYAAAVFYDPWRLEIDQLATGYEEERVVTIGAVGMDELTAVSTVRGPVIRLISARRATADERREYWKNRELYL